MKDAYLPEGMTRRELDLQVELNRTRGCAGVAFSWVATGGGVSALLYWTENLPDAALLSLVSLGFCGLCLWPAVRPLLRPTKRG